jgi:predicted metal-dependent hydrolase
MSADAAPLQLSLFEDPLAGVEVGVVRQLSTPPARDLTTRLREGAGAPLPPPDRFEPPAAPSVFVHPRADRETVLGGHRVAFEFRRARRRSIGFVVGLEGLTVSAPRWVGYADVEAALREKADWILRKLQEQHSRARHLAQARVEWRDGTSLPFLGETVIIVLDPRVTGAVLHTDVTTLPGVPRLTLHVGLPHTAASEQLREAVQSWLQRQARRIFEERCAEFARRLNVQVRRLSLSSASTRWGSASADGSIRLNWRLVHFALPVIDYVVAHELAHLREMNHSEAFWAVVRSVVPDYRQARGLLKSEVLPQLD